MPIRSSSLLSSLLVSSLFVGCPVSDPGVEGEGEAAEGEGDAGEGEGDAAEGEGEGDAGEEACPYQTFNPCGGDVVGAWTIRQFCPVEGESLTGPCEGGFSSTAGCEGENDQAVCTQLYGGSVNFAADGSAVIENSVGVARDEVFSASCVIAATGNADAAAGCAGLASADNRCTFGDGACRCLSSADFGDQTINADYTVDADGLHVLPPGSDPIDGAYCVDGDTLTLTNAFGWPFWLLDRS